MEQNKEKENNKNKGKNNKIKDLSFETKVFLLIGLVAITAIVYGLYSYSEKKAVIHECKEIEKGILNNPELQQDNVSCVCYPGYLYINKLNFSKELKAKANLRYVVFCESNGTQRIYPIWKAK